MRTEIPTTRMFAPTVYEDGWKAKYPIEEHQILSIEYHRGIPFSVTTRFDTFDFEHCPMDGITVYHSSGSGSSLPYIHRVSPGENGKPDCQIWIAGSVKRIRDGSTRRRKHPKPNEAYVGGKETWKYRHEKPIPRPDDRTFYRMGWEVLKAPIAARTWNGEPQPNPFWWPQTEEGTAEYCDICGEHRAHDDYSEPCEHLYWCYGHGAWTGPGSTDPCGCTREQADEE